MNKRNICTAVTLCALLSIFAPTIVSTDAVARGNVTGRINEGCTRNADEAGRQTSCTVGRWISAPDKVTARRA